MVINTVTLLHLCLQDSKDVILIDSNGRARLADPGLRTIETNEPADASSFTLGDSVRWMSPELFNPEIGLDGGGPTKESDCYALGMVIYEVLSGQVPFDGYNQLAVVASVMGGKRPQRPQGEGGKLFTDKIWDTLELCWKPQPRDRIRALAVLLRLAGVPPLLMRFIEVIL